MRIFEPGRLEGNEVFTCATPGRQAPNVFGGLADARINMRQTQRSTPWRA
jgi:hypothetical protein